MTTEQKTDYPNGYVGAEYVCHKRVRAAKIQSFRMLPRDSIEDDVRVILEFGDGENLPSLIVRLAEVRGIEVGGYLVHYVDGYRSYSPAKAFEEGYTRVEPPPKKTGPICEGCGE